MRAAGVRRPLAVLVAGLLAVGVVSALPASAVDGPTLSVGDQSGLERDSVTGSVFVPITLSAPAAAPVVVSYWTVDGTAGAGVDYTRWGTPTNPRTVTIPTGAVQTQVNVPVLADNDTEPDETFSVVVTATGGDVVIGDDTGIATIVDADAASTVNPAITVSDTTVTEGDQGNRLAQFLVHLSRPPASNVTITYSTADGSAVAGVDYTAKLPGTVVFAPGQISKTIDVAILPNTTPDATRDFSLDVAVTGGSPVEELDMVGTATIIDDDTAAPASCAPGTYNTTDGNEPCTPAPPGFYVDTAGALSATPCAPGSFQDQAGQTSCQLAPIGTYVQNTGQTAATSCPDGATTESPGATSPDDCVPVPVGALEVAVGDRHACALLSDGAVSCWGSNASGQLGNGTNADSNVPVPVTGLTTAVAVTAGGSSTCALLLGGAVSCWGANDVGQLGNGTVADSNLPVPVTGVTDAAQVIAGYAHVCAVLDDRTLTCWGNDGYGQLGDGNTGTQSSVPVTAAGLTDVRGVALGSSHTCALLYDGTARCWGYNYAGRLGDGTTTDSTAPVVVGGLTGATAIAAGFNHTCAVVDGGVACWGQGTSGVLGNGATTDSYLPAAVPGLSEITAISGGTSHTCALRSDGSATCWGNNSYSQLGDGTTGQPFSASPVDVEGLTGAAAIDGGLYSSCAALGDGSVACWGSNSQGQLGNGRSFGFASTTVEVSGVVDAVSVTAGGSHSCAALGDGSARCWGANGFGQLGNGGSTDTNTPVPVQGLSDVASVSAGERHACAVLEDGTARCWGRGGLGQLGNGAFGDSATPVEVSGLSDAVAIAAGADHSCALLADGTVRCWGDNGSGELGNGTTVSSYAVPVTVTGLTNAINIAAGSSHSCAVLADGSARCWGNNAAGQLGITAGSNRRSPVTVTGLSNAGQITAGGAHTCAVLTDGSARCWGTRSQGRLGNGQTGTGYLLQVTVLGLTDATAVTAGLAHGCAVMADATVRCWGPNQAVGNGLASGFSAPTAVEGLTGVVQADAGYSHSCAVLVGGAVSCWGSSNEGRLGDGGGFSAVPTPVSGLT